MARHLLQSAVSFHRAGNLPQADRLYRDILARDPDNFDACHLRGLVQHQSGRHQDALRLIEHAVRIDPDQAAAHSNLGAVLLALRRPDDSLACCDRALRLDPGCADAHANRGSALSMLRRLDDALSCFEQALRLKPGDLDARLDHAALLQKLGRPREALLSLDAGLRLHPDHAGLHNNRGNVLRDLHRPLDALQDYDRAIALKPDYAEAFNNRGVALSDLKRFEAALASFDVGLLFAPDHAGLYNNRGHALKGLGRFDEAAQNFDRAVALDPDYAEAFSNRGVMLADLDRPDEALASYDLGLRADPRHAGLHNNRGNVLRDLRRFEEALASHRRAVACDPRMAGAWFNLSLGLLARAQFSEGWRAYEWRWMLKEYAWIGDHPGILEKPQWAGEDISTKVILVYAEQGLGDTLQFVRYVPLLVKRARRVVLMVLPTLIPVLKSMEGVTLVGREDVPPHFDVRSPLLSLPRVFGTDADTIPADIPYLAADATAVERWRARLGGDGVRIGIAWQGNPRARIDRGRSIPLAAFAPLAAIPGVRLISLQKDVGADQLRHCPAGMNVETLGPDFDAGPGAFLDAAAVAMSLDLVITSDTSLAHLAGALGRETWVALKAVPDWRWQLDRLDSPWYPTMRLFRQREPGDWTSIFAEIADELAGYVARRAGRGPT